SPRAEFEVFEGLAAQTFLTPHTSESLAVRLTDADGASLVYTSDTGYTEALAGFARSADLFLMECSFFRSKPVKTHLELEDAMKLARRTGDRKSTRLNSSHRTISYAVFCLKKKKILMIGENNK